MKEKLKVGDKVGYIYDSRLYVTEILKTEERTNNFGRTYVTVYRVTGLEGYMIEGELVLLEDIKQSIE